MNFFTKISLVLGALFVLIPSNFALAANAALPSIFQDNFNYLAGSIIGQGNWINYANGQNFIVENAAFHKKGGVLHNNSLGDSEVSKTGASLADGQQSISVRTESRANWGTYLDGNAQVRISKGPSFASSIFLAISFKADGNVAYYNPVADAYQNFGTYKDNQWARLDVQWRSSDKTARYRINNGAWTNWMTFNNAASFTNFDNVGFGFVLPSGSGGVYFDTVH